MAKPTEDQFLLAIDWLLCNEGEEGGEREACEAVAKWLTERLLAQSLREVAREKGIPVAKLVKALQQAKEKSNETR